MQKLENEINLIGLHSRSIRFIWKKRFSAPHVCWFRFVCVRVCARCRRTALSVSCPGLVFVRIFQKILFQKSCPENPVCLDSVPCPDSVRIFRKKTFRCLSVRPDNDEKELSCPPTSGLCFCPSVFRILDHFFEENSRYSLGVRVSRL